MATLDAEDYQNIAEAVFNRLMGANTSPNMGLIQVLSQGDLEAAMDARERELRAKRKGKRRTA